MSHFEKGVLKDDPLDNLAEAGELLKAAFLETAKACENSYDIWMNAEISGYFKQGEWISIRMKDLPDLVVDALAIPPALIRA